MFCLPVEGFDGNSSVLSDMLSSGLFPSSLLVEDASTIVFEVVALHLLAFFSTFL